MTWLVTGGAGYVGAHVVRAMLDNGHEVVVLDDLSTGLAGRVDSRATFIEGSLLDQASLGRALDGVDGVVHIAAKKQVGESVAQPLYYYRQNVVALQLLLEGCAAAGIDKLVFSSSCSVYGMPDVDRVVESTPLLPMSPYGESKHTGERMINALAAASSLRTVNLRYFNVAGAGAPELGDPEVFHLIPLVFQAMSRNQPVRVFGGDYPTPDGSCIRDYVHVADIADAHLRAANALVEGYSGGTFNVGCGTGSSVLEVIDVVREVTGVDVPHQVVERRPGDPARIVASVEAIDKELGFRTARDLREMVLSAWQAWQVRPQED
jgi:UDP-glucose 4-epimerase